MLHRRPPRSVAGGVIGIVNSGQKSSSTSPGPGCARAWRSQAIAVLRASRANQAEGVRFRHRRSAFFMGLPVFTFAAATKTTALQQYLSTAVAAAP